MASSASLSFFGLDEHQRRDTGLAEIVQHAAEDQRYHIITVETHLLTEAHGEHCGVETVASVVLLRELQGGGELQRVGVQLQAVMHLRHHFLELSEIQGLAGVAAAKYVRQAGARPAVQFRDAFQVGGEVGLDLAFLLQGCLDEGGGVTRIECT